MPPSAQLRRVEWVSYSDGEAKSKLRYMKAIRRTCECGKVIVHWQLRPMLDCIETERSGWLTQRGMKGGPGFLSDEFELDTEYPWFIESRRALSLQQRKHEADGGSTLASSDFFQSSSGVLLQKA